MNKKILLFVRIQLNMKRLRVSDHEENSFETIEREEINDSVVADTDKAKKLKLPAVTKIKGRPKHGLVTTNRYIKSKGNLPQKSTWFVKTWVFYTSSV